MEPARRMKKTVLITGGSKGIGLATARLLLQKGFRVILLARDEARLKKVKREFIQRGFAPGDIEIASVDLGDAPALRALVPTLKLLQGGLCGLVNNAASEILKRVTEFTVAEMDQTWRVNMLAPIVLIQACHPYLKKARGSIVNVGSVSDFDVAPRYSVYGGSKAFLLAFTKHAATELGFDGIRVNTVTPGGVDTPLMREVEKTFPKSVIAAAKRRIPIGQRWARADEIAEAICFALIGPRYLHGADIRVHGGIQ